MKWLRLMSYSESVEAAQMIALLDEHGIENKLEKSGEDNDLDGGFRGYFHGNSMNLMVGADDIEAATALLNEQLGEGVAEVASSETPNLVEEMSLEELVEEVSLAEDMDSPFIEQAIEKLKENGYSDHDIRNLRGQKDAEIEMGKDTNTITMIAGYLYAFAGGMIGIFIGSYLRSHKTKNSKGKPFYTYNEETRAHGTRMMYIAIIPSIISACLLVYWVMREA